MGYEIGDEPSEDDEAVVVASHGRDEEQTLIAAVDAGVSYIGLVASRKRGQAVLASLDLPTDKVHTPAGLDIGARTPEEVALSILAEIVATRRTRTTPRWSTTRAIAAMSDPFVAGLVLAAGGSNRLGRPKQLLPYNGGTLLDHGELDPVQQGFHELHALQCGFCTPGMMMTVRALLDENSDPSEEEIRTAISGGICRCTGYKNIVAAARWAAQHERQEV